MSLNELIHKEMRLRIMTTLMSVDEADFTYLQKQTNSTSGNLSSHLDKLASAHYVSITKDYFNHKPRTTVRLTDTGREALTAYLTELQEILGATGG